MLESIGRDVRYAVRVLAKAPAFAITAVATLAVAVGINAAVFTVVDAVLLRPLPYPAPERLGLVHATVTSDGDVQRMTSQHGVTWAVIREHVTTADRAVFSTWTAGINVAFGSQASFAEQQRVGAGFFAVLGVHPAIGREFSAEEDRPGGPPAAMLSHHYWRALGADPAIVGRTITLRGEPHTVVGVMPAGFHSGVDADLWRPLRATVDGEGEGENYQILLRLQDGRSWEDADAELQPLGAEITRQRPMRAGASVLFATIPLQAGMTESMSRPLLLLWSGVAIVLLIATVNLAGLQLARAARRTREIATRLALGCGATAIARQLVIEGLVLAAAGGAVGLALAAAAVGALGGALQALGVWQPLHVDARVAVTTLALALASGAVFGIVPAIPSARLDVQRGLGAAGARTVAGGSARWPRRALVVAQVALGVVLLSGAGLLVRTFMYLHTLEPGFDGRHAIAATISLEDARYRTSAQVTTLVDATLARLRESSQVEAAAVSLGLPYERLLNLGFRHLDGPEASSPQGRMTSATYVAGDFFGTLRIPLRAGRTFTEADTSVAPGVVVVNDTLARQYFERANPVGRRIAFAGREREIVGVVGDVQLRPGFGDHGPLAPMPLAYIPLSQANDGFLRLVHGWFSPSFVVRARGPAASVVPVMRAAVDTSDPLLPFAKVRPLDDVKATALAQPRVFMLVLVAMAATAVLLAALGIHGLIAASVTERTREMGIRLALGATARHATWTLAAPGLLLALAGIAIGAAAARSASSLLAAFVWGVSPTDPLTFTAVGLLLAIVATAASLLPALRILRLDPAVTLRE